MTTIDLTAPYRMKSATLTIEDDDYTAAVSAVTLAPTAPAAWKGIGGNRRTAEPDWTCNLTAAQDLTPTSLQRYLLANVGQEKAATFTPHDGGPTIDVNLVIAAPSIGGAASDSAPLLEFTVAMECAGTPALTDPTP